MSDLGTSRSPSSCLSATVRLLHLHGRFSSGPQLFVPGLRAFPFLDPRSMLPFPNAGSNNPREFHARGHNPKTQNQPYRCHTKLVTESVFQWNMVSTGVAGHELKHT